MGNYDINSNSTLVKLMIENAKRAYDDLLKNRPRSLIPVFVRELTDNGFEFELPNQVAGFLPKYKAQILPLAIRYYQTAKDKDDKDYFLSLFHFKGFDEVVPMLLDDFKSSSPIINRYAIGDCLLTIQSKHFISDYIEIISSEEYGKSRAMLILLVGKFQVEEAIPLLISALDDEDIRSHAIIALGNYKRKELRFYFERFINDSNRYIRKYAKSAIDKIDNKS